MSHLSAPMTAKTTLWMCVALAAGILAAWLVVVLGTPTKRAEAAFPGKNGKIVFESHPDLDNSEIVTMNANGDNKTILTNTRTWVSDPAFSPNGKTIAFTRVRSDNPDIYTMSANGTDIKRVTRSESADFDPAWSPDGTKIAFASGRNGNTDIYVINKDGTGLTRLTTSPQFDSDPAWSPDGTRIAFAINRTKLYTIKPDGSDQIRLTTTSLGGAPAWSPDGTKIAFRGKRRLHTHTDWRIFVMKAKPESETNRPKRLTGSSPRGDDDPDWQPLPAGSG